MWRGAPNFRDPFYYPKGVVGGERGGCHPVLAPLRQLMEDMDTGMGSHFSHGRGSGLGAHSGRWRGGRWGRGSILGRIPGQGWGMMMSSCCPGPAKGQTEGLPGVW